MGASTAALELLISLSDRASPGLQALGGTLSSIGGLATVGAGAAIAAIGGIGAAAVGIAGDVDQAARNLQATLGVSAEKAQELGDVALNVFGNNFGASVEEAAQAVGLVEQQLGNLGGATQRGGFSESG